MIKVGIDIIEIERIEHSVKTYGEYFLNKILTEKEKTYCLSKSNPYPSIAASFAAKEAFSKAYGTGIARPLHWKSIEVLRTPSPVIQFTHELNIQEHQISLSISHTRLYACATVIIEL